MVIRGTFTCRSPRGWLSCLKYRYITYRNHTKKQTRKPTWLSNKHPTPGGGDAFVANRLRLHTIEPYLNYSLKCLWLLTTKQGIIIRQKKWTTFLVRENSKSGAVVHYFCPDLRSRMFIIVFVQSLHNCWRIAGTRVISTFDNWKNI